MATLPAPTPLSERWIRDLAKRHGLEVYKRITTGNDDRHFATFELTGRVDRLSDAWQEIKPHKRSKGNSFETWATTQEHHPEAGRPYIALSSIWCDERLP